MFYQRIAVMWWKIDRDLSFRFFQGVGYLCPEKVGIFFRKLRSIDPRRLRHHIFGARESCKDFTSSSLVGNGVRDDNISEWRSKL
jgi:hypothetical protein